MTASDAPERPPAGLTLGRWKGAILTDLLASQGLGYLDDPEARQLLAVYAREMQTNVDRQQAVQDDWTSRVTTYLSGNLSLPDLIDWDLDVPGLKGGTFAVDGQAFLGSREFANLLTHQAFLLSLLESSRQDLLQTADEILQALEAM